MIGASKILTVSYGTFSCTLEGFDDPFNTMRAIAEYFRDLAAEDRYFGAEPPTPDAAMLLKIAEREVQRRVEAKIQDNGVVLRTGAAMQAPAYMPAPQPQAPAAVAAPRADPTPPPMPDGVAAKLLRIRAAVSNAELAVTRDAAPTAFSPARPILTDYTEDQHAEDFSSTDAFAATFEDQGFATLAVDAETWDQAEEMLAEADLTEAEAEAEAEVEVEVETEAEADSADADQGASDALPGRIAESADAPESAAETAPLPEVDLSALADRLADTAPGLPASDASAVAKTDALADLAQLVSAPANAEAEANADAEANAEADPELATADGDVFDDEMADADYAISPDDLADLQALDAASGDATSFETPAPTTDVYGEDVDQPPEHAEVAPSRLPADDAFADEEDVAEQTAGDAVADEVAVSRLPADDAFADAEDVAEQTAQAAVDPVLEEIDSVYAPLDEPARGPSAKALRARARVIKVRRDQAVAAVTLAAVTLPADASADVAAMLAADAENALRRNLRALQAESGTPNPKDVDDKTGAEDDARRRLEAAGEEAVSRLIEQTNEAMAVPENRRRLSAIAHLKAAVAATVADRFSRGTSAPKEAETKRLGPYRDDLARVVRPQHPTGNDDAPIAPRPAPLVLVSAQRIDRPRTAPGESTTPLASVPNMPVRPRRVTSPQQAVDPAAALDEDDDDIDTANIFTDARGFAEFSERLGANSLAEILEAAAAYSVCIEGRPYFSRPELMGQIGALSSDSEFTREDGLRTFGMLLREGRIQKIKRGRFVLTETSHYLAEARKIAG